ncbi:MAG: UPF0175 family protein [Caldilineaceae bacterium]|nr:UPF0175 family protein [Caldilineaceae bacterium]
MTVLDIDTPPTDEKTDWLLLSEAALKVGNFASLDELILQALDTWVDQLNPESRWKIAIELYTGDEISTGRAAEIAGLDYVSFMEKLRVHGIPFMAAQSTNDEQKQREEALLDELISI